MKIIYSHTIFLVREYKFIKTKGIKYSSTLHFASAIIVLTIITIIGLPVLHYKARKREKV